MVLEDVSAMVIVVLGELLVNEHRARADVPLLRGEEALDGEARGPFG